MNGCLHSQQQDHMACWLWLCSCRSVHLYDCLVFSTIFCPKYDNAILQSQRQFLTRLKYCIMFRFSYVFFIYVVILNFVNCSLAGAICLNQIEAGLRLKLSLVKRVFLTIPHSSAHYEQVFSFIRKVTEQSASLGEKMSEALLSTCADVQT